MSLYNKGNSSQKAVALKYDNSVATPVIVASGLGYIAEKIIEVASENKVPVYEDTSLATVLSQLELGSEIPEELYKAIVDIYVYFLNFNSDESQIQNKQEVQNIDKQVVDIPLNNAQQKTNESNMPVNDNTNAKSKEVNNVAKSVLNKLDNLNSNTNS